jgi:hypothetical protein
MINLNAELEVGILAATAVVMFCIIIWQFFRCTKRRENPLAEKLMPIANNKNKSVESEPLFLPSNHLPSKYLFTTPNRGAEIFNKSMRLMPSPQKPVSSFNLPVEKGSG